LLVDLFNCLRPGKAYLQEGCAFRDQGLLLISLQKVHCFGCDKDAALHYYRDLFQKKVLLKGYLVARLRGWAIGIINITPDSFYKDSRHAVVDDVLFTAERMLQDGLSV